MAKIILDYFLENVEKYGNNKTFMTQPMGDGKVLEFSYQQVQEEASKMAGHLASLNLEPKSHIAICSKNCAWWVMADLAITMAGHVTIPIFPTLTKEITRYTLEHSESQLLFVGKMDDKPYAEMKEGFTDIPTISFPLSPPDSADQGWEAIIESLTPTLMTPVPRELDEMATIIYTSGSTGKPKGVMISFQAMLTTTEGICSYLKVNANDRYLSYLPCAHGMERWIGVCVPLYSGEQLFFAESLDTFIEDLNRAQPTLFLSVPRLWTKFQAGIFAKIPEKKLNRLLKIPCLSSLLKKVLLKKLGLSKVRMAGSGSAPLSKDVLQWYRNLGLELMEGYGMTENFNYSHMARPGRGLAGYVGEPWEGVECRISETDGEIHVKTPGKMMGYYKNPEATKEAFTEDGWVRTGDKGAIMEHKGAPLLKITGRTKEIFKTAKGKYVAPAPLENILVGHNLVELALVTGAGYPQPFALIQLSEAPKRKALGDASVREQYAKDLEAHVKAAVNANVEAHEKLQFIAIVSEEWLPENGFLTPTQKIKRSVIESHYESNYDEWFDKKEPVVWLGFEGKKETAATATVGGGKDESEKSMDC